MSGLAHFRNLAPRQNSYEEKSLRWRQCVRFDRARSRTAMSLTSVLTARFLGLNSTFKLSVEISKFINER